MEGTASRSLPSSNIVIFDSSSSPLHPSSSILIPCRNGPQKLTGLVKRGRPRKEHQISPSGEGNEESQINEHSSLSKFSFVTYTASPQNAGPKIQKFVRRRAMLHYRRQEREQKTVREVAKKSRANCPANHICPEAKKDNNKAFRLYIADDSKNSALPTTTTDLLPKGITAVEPFNAFPIKIEPYMLELLSSYTTFIYENMYTLEKHVNLNPAKDYWLPMAFQDAALLHAFIFCADGHSTISQGRKEGPAAVIHLRKAIQIVNERLRAPVPSITDATIAVVCTFAHTEMLNGNHENWIVHMRGLKQMLRHRGGMQAFESNRLVRSKINRADLCGSIDAVQSPYFECVVSELPTMPGYHQMTTITATGFVKITSSIKLDEALTRILCQIQHVTSSLNMFYHHKTQIHPLSLREVITSSQYSLLSFKLQQKKTVRENLVHEMLRLGLLVYLVTLLNESPSEVSLYDMLGARLKSTLIEVRRNGGLDLEFSLWILFIAASVVKDPDTKGYFTASATEIIDELGVSCWDNIETLFKSFFWVEKIHRGTFKLIFEGRIQP
ncbi:hypothetical protein B0J11DRAFT_473782 [Dendryphion nanum]|uniref:Tachykinin family protein n=1 Tax=Dendryphion nanum TaxID=256645 RepID=A0A9P9I7N4_9PLEO|nr:hypothetical protein B0J11DRAFT_473782 [Dendryphion nanum]